MKDQFPTEEVQAAIKKMPAPKADPEFRAGLKARFAKNLQSGGRQGLLVPFGDLHAHRFPRHRRWFTGIMAAAILAFVFTWLIQPQPVWRITQAVPHSRLVINKAEVTGGDMTGELLPGDCFLHHLGPGLLQIDYPGRMTWVLEPGTRIRLKGSTVISGKEPLTARILTGVAMGATGPEFPTEGLDFTTNDLSAHVSGTTFGVLAGPDSTCVCVLEGTVHLTDGDASPIPSGSSVTVFLDKPNLSRELKATETAGLQDTRKLAQQQ